MKRWSGECERWSGWLGSEHTCDACRVVSCAGEWPEEAGNGEAPCGRHGGLGSTPQRRCFDAATKLVHSGGGGAAHGGHLGTRGAAQGPPVAASEARRCKGVGKLKLGPMAMEMGMGIFPSVLDGRGNGMRALLAFKVEATGRWHQTQVGGVTTAGCSVGMLRAVGR
jgi:hypothetical protein